MGADKLVKGDKVMIVECDDYIPQVKKHYGKELEISKTVTTKGGLTLYKVKGIPGYTTRKCLRKI